MRRARSDQLGIAQSAGDQQSFVKTENLADECAEFDTVDHRCSTNVPNPCQLARRQFREHLSDVRRPTWRDELFLDQTDLWFLLKCGHHPTTEDGSTGRSPAVHDCVSGNRP